MHSPKSSSPVSDYSPDTYQLTEGASAALNAAYGFLRTDAPCALIDGYGVVLATNPAFDALLPLSRGHSLVAQLDSVVALTDPDTGGVIDVTYRRGACESVPARLHLLPLAASDPVRALALLSDGAPIRDAEAARFDITPCPILRVGMHGAITFANRETARSFGTHHDRLVEQPLASLFDREYAAQIGEAIVTCIVERKSISLKVDAATHGYGKARRVVLVMTPDPAPVGAPLGVLIVIQAATQTVRDQIRSITLKSDAGTLDNKAGAQATRPIDKARCVPWKEQLTLVLEQIHTVIEFDHAIFGTYGDGAMLFRAEALFPDDSPAWPARWLTLPAGMQGFLTASDTSIPDMNAFVDQYPEFRDNEVVRCYREMGIQSSVTLVARLGDEFTSALTLCSRELGKFHAVHCDQLRELDLVPLLLRYERQIATERQAFCARMRDLLDKKEELGDAARSIVDQIAQHFKWDYVGLFRVNRFKERFELFHQAPGLAEFQLPHGYSQDIKEGMLASTLKSRGVCVVNQIGVAGEQHGYVSGHRADAPSRNLNSAMTIPVHLNGRIRWIFNVECGPSDAFRGPDEASILEVIASVEHGLMHRMLGDMKQCLFNETERGVVVATTEGVIVEMNHSAEILLGITQAECVRRDAHLRDFGADEHARYVIAAQDRPDKKRIVLTNEGKRDKVALTTRVDLDSAFDASVWFLTDVEGAEWNRSLRFLRETVTEVAQQTREPLALASLLVREMVHLAEQQHEQAETDENVNAKAAQGKAITPRVLGAQLRAEISKADITLERLADAVSIRMHPIRTNQPFDVLRCVHDALLALPERDRECVTQRPQRSVWIDGDPGRLTYVMRSVLAHLLRVRHRDTGKVAVTLDGDGTQARLALHVRDAPRVSAGFDATHDKDEDIDALLAASREARESVRLSLRSVRRIVSAHGGSLQTTAGSIPESDGARRWIGFEMTFPLSQGRAV